MSIVTNFSDLDLTKQYSYSDYLLWKFSERVELIKGFIMKMSPAPSTNHQQISQNINYELLTFFKKKPCSVFEAPFDVRLNIKSTKKNITVVQPDICVICDESKIDERGCEGSPDLIVEIISHNNSKHDLQTKFNLYQEAKVQEYWIVEPMEKMVLVYSLLDGQYVGSKPYTVGDVLQSKLFSEFKIDIDEVFYKVKF